MMTETSRPTIRRLILLASLSSAYFFIISANLSSCFLVRDDVSDNMQRSYHQQQRHLLTHASAARHITVSNPQIAFRESNNTIEAHIHTPPVKTPPTPNAECARLYMDSLLADPSAARKQLCGDNFTKQSNVAVVFTCYKRMDMIHRALPSVLLSNGIRNFDVFISQDGGNAPPIFDDEVFSIPSDMPYVYIRHPVNLCTGLHMHFVKAFAFDIMGYDILLIVEEDNVLHPQALQLLNRMVELSVHEPDVGVVSLLDMDMGPFLDASRFSAGIIPVLSTTGHLWVFGLHRVKYDAIREMMNSYYETIKGYEYRAKHHPPLRPRIEALLQTYGFPVQGPLSQDRFFLNSLAKVNFTKRYQTLFRFFQPIGVSGLHFKYNTSRFVHMFGKHMYNGFINPSAAFDVTKDPGHIKAIKDSVRQRLSRLFQKYRRSFPSESLVNSTFFGIMEGRLNGQGVAHNLRGTSNFSGPTSPACEVHRIHGDI